MRAESIFKFAYMAILVTSLGVGIGAATPAYAQLIGDDDEPIFEDDEPLFEDEEDEEPFEEEEEEPPFVDEEPEFEEETGLEQEADNPSSNFTSDNRRPIVKSDREAFGIPLKRRISTSSTDRITEAIRGSYQLCEGIRDDRYLVDCIGERLLRIARSLPKTSEYDEAREILIEAAKELRALATANQAPRAPRIHAVGRVGKAVVRTRPLTPVRRDTVPRVKREAADILQEAETKLLRAAQASDRRLIAYAQIARAVGSNKRLLRSA